MPNSTPEDIERLRKRIEESEEVSEDDRENLLRCSRIMGRHQTGKRGWSHDRHESVLQRLIMLSWGGNKYDGDEHHSTTLSAALEDKDAAGEIVEWINRTYDNEETNRDMRNALRTFGKVLNSDDPTHKNAKPPDSIDWVPSTVSETHDPLPNPAEMIEWEEVEAMCDHPETNARDAALIALAWDLGPRSGELQDLTVGDISDHNVGKVVRIEEGKTGSRHGTITNAVPYLQQWLSQHPASDDPDAPLWSKLKSPEPISYRMYRDIFKNAAERVGLEKPNDPTNFRKSSASELASRGISQAHLEKRYGWTRGSDAAARYIQVFGEDADRALAEARGMDIDIEEPEPTGPKQCVRCPELIKRDADECHRCGAIQDRKQAQEMVLVDSDRLADMMQKALTVAAQRGESPLDDADPQELREGLPDVGPAYSSDE